MAATWSGWIIEFLDRANILNTPPLQTFMSEWAKHAPGSCKNNPIDLTASVSGSTRCGDTVGGFGRSQNYGTHAEAAHAFAIQMHTPWVKPLLDVLNSGNPFQVADRSQAIAVLNRWASPSFATWYASATVDGSGGGGGGASTKAPHTHSGYHDLQRSVERRWPKATAQSQRSVAAALRSLGHGRKVRG